MKEIQINPLLYNKKRLEWVLPSSLANIIRYSLTLKEGYLYVTRLKIFLMATTDYVLNVDKNGHTNLIFTHKITPVN